MTIHSCLFGLSYSVDPIDEEEEREAGEDSDFELLDDIDLDDSVQMVNLTTCLTVETLTFICTTRYRGHNKSVHLDVHVQICEHAYIPVFTHYTQ